VKRVGCGIVSKKGWTLEGSPLGGICRYLQMVIGARLDFEAARQTRCGYIFLLDREGDLFAVWRGSTDRNFSQRIVAAKRDLGI